MKNFFRDRIAELHNITWPTKKQAIHSMVLVMIIMLLVGTFLSVSDSLLDKVVLYLLDLDFGVSK